MDALEFVKETKRMCDSCTKCENCPAESIRCNIIDCLDELLPIVEKWAAEHPKEKKPKTVKASELAIDTKVWCWDANENNKCSRCFALSHNGQLYSYPGRYTSKNSNILARWEHMTLEDGTIVLPE